MLQVVFGVFSQIGLKLRLHASAEDVQPRHLRQQLAVVSAQRDAQNTRCTRVARADTTLAVEHQHARGEVVQNSLQIGAGCVDLAHALLHGRARI